MNFPGYLTPEVLIRSRTFLNSPIDFCPVLPQETRRSTSIHVCLVHGGCALVLRGYRPTRDHTCVDLSPCAPSPIVRLRPSSTLRRRWDGDERLTDTVLLGRDVVDEPSRRLLVTLHIMCHGPGRVCDVLVTGDTLCMCLWVHCHQYQATITKLMEGPCLTVFCEQIIYTVSKRHDTHLDL